MTLFYGHKKVPLVKTCFQIQKVPWHVFGWKPKNMFFGLILPQFSFFSFFTFFMQNMWDKHILTNVGRAPHPTAGKNTQQPFTRIAKILATCSLFLRINSKDAHTSLTLGLLNTSVTKTRIYSVCQNCRSN